MAERIIKKKRSEWWKGLLIALLVIVIIIGTPIAAVFIAFYDDAQNSTYQNTNETSTEVFSRVLNSCLDEVGTTEQVSFKITENDLNQILVPVVEEKLAGVASQFINAFYVDITEDEYNFIIEVKEEYLNVFKSKIILHTEMVHYSNENVDEDYFEFKINDIQIGRTKGLLSLGKTLITSFGLDGYISDFLGYSGLNMNVDFANSRITYKTKDLVHDIFTMAGNMGDGFNEIFPSIVNSCIENGAFAFNFYLNETLAMNLNLHTFGFNDEYCSENNEINGFNIDIQKHIEDLVTLVDNGIVEFDVIGNLMHYLIHGYERTDSTNQTLVKSLDLSSIGIGDQTTYVGDNLPEPVSLRDEVSEQIKNATLDSLGTRHLATITEDTMNQMVGATNIIGYSLLLPANDGEGHSKISFVTVDKFYINIEDNIIKAVARLNINGFYSYLILEYEVDETQNNNFKLVLKPKHTLLGNIEAEDEIVHHFYKIIGEAFGELDSTSLDVTTGTLTIDFSNAFEVAGNLEQILLFGQPVVSLKGQNLEDDGIISIDF